MTHQDSSPDPQSRSTLAFSRRAFLHFSAAAGAYSLITEPMLAAAAGAHRPVTPDAVMIDSNENPLGPCQAAREAISAIIPQGGRYCDPLTKELIHTFADMEGLKPEWIRAFAGSTQP